MKRFAYLACLLSFVGLTLVTTESYALTLGRLKVLSTLGQPLIAEIEVPEITLDEASTLRIAVANPEAFKTAGLDYNPVVGALSITGQRRADGRAVLELKSTQVMTDPFLDLVLEITWSTGRMLRDYTLLLDPPNPNSPPLTVLNVAPPAPTVTPTASLPIQSAPTPPAVANPVPVNALAAAPAPTIKAPPAVAAPDRPVLGNTSFSVKTQAVDSKYEVATRASKLSAGGKKRVTVAKGDTAAAIANANKPEGISLDQMLVAMLRANPQAFVDGNVNRLKAGVLLDIPLDADVAEVKKTEAQTTIQAQARDFNEYRKKLANNTTAQPSEVSKRVAGGRATAKVEERQSAAPAPDRLTLAKPTPSGKAADASEEKIAKERAAADAAKRTSELQKNISELKKISPAAVVPAAQSSAPAASIAAAALPSAAISSPVELASAPVVAPPPMLPKKSTSFMDQVISSAWTLPATGGLVVALALVALFRNKKRKKDAHASGMDSMNFPITQHDPTDTVFGALGASQVDTQESLGGNTTMVYPPSQLSNATGDVDPIAEADVYLAYNRDVQAEEILKEAKRNTPNRTDIYVKLMSLYLKRHDVDAFDAVAKDLHSVCDGVGGDWSLARDLAREIGSTSPLFHVPGSAFAVSEAPASPAAYASNSLSFSAAPLQEHVVAQAIAPVPHEQSSGLIDFDLSALTLDLPSDPPSQMVDAAHGIEDTKLALAEEYLSIGDKAGARSLIEEVIAQANPLTLSLAHQMLARLG